MNGGAGPGRLDLMDAALAGLSVGDAFGDQFFLAANRGLSPDDEPPGPWDTTAAITGGIVATQLDMLEPMYDKRRMRVSSKAQV
jgi:hypothetical protein